MSLHVDSLAFELVDGVRGQDFETGLRQRGGGRAALRTHQTKAVSVDANQAIQRLGSAGPVPGGISVQLVTYGPDGEIGIAGHEWGGGWTQGGLREGGRGKREKQEGRPTS